MSVVCAKVYKDEIVLAADSILVRGWSSKTTEHTFSKLNKVNGIIIGSCGFAQEHSLMTHYMETHKPKNATTKAILDFMVEFTKWKKDYETSAEIKNCYIIAFDGKCFEVSCLFVTEIETYSAIGAGEDFAMAALYLGHSPKEAVKVACDLSCFVAEPIIEEKMRINSKD